jgi:hypothetical protein
VISNWREYTEARFEPVPGSTHFRWRLNVDLRPEMTPEFRRLYDRVHRRIARMDPQWRAVVGFSRRYVEVATRKYKSRKRRGRR